jgi:hypothetical protein
MDGRRSGTDIVLPTHDTLVEDDMSMLVWGWAGVWLVWRLWLEWQVDQCWLPEAGEVREDYSRWSVPPAGALTAEGERLWRLRYRVTAWGFTGWVALAGLWLVS